MPRLALVDPAQLPTLDDGPASNVPLLPSGTASGAAR
jgi:hypothetical protein